MRRKFWLFMYRVGLYKARLVGDGRTDNSRALQTRFDYIAQCGGVMYLPPGTFRVGR